jgi:hypothetical protein
MNAQQGWAYAAGLYETSGWINIKRRSDRRRYVNLCIGMTDRDPLVKAHEWTGGNLLGPYARRGGGLLPEGDYKPRYVLVLTKRDQIDAFLDHCYWNLTPERRAQLDAAMVEDTRYQEWKRPA